MFTRIYSCLWAALTLVVVAIAPAVAHADETAVTGRVAATDGGPLSGAQVIVFTAGPKIGTNPTCPSCYPDCGKSVKTDADGKFTLPGLSSQLVFRLLVVAKGYVPKFVPGVLAGQRGIETALAPRSNAHVPDAQIVRGRLVDPRGAPVVGAVVEVTGVAVGGGRTRYGGIKETDPLDVSDEAGEFTFAANTPIEALWVRTSARLFANQATLLAMGKTHTLTLTEGATLAGRVLLNGQPLANVSLGVSPLDRAAGSFVGNFEIGTDANGRFSLTNLPPKTDYSIYGKMETMGAFGSLAPRRVRVGADGSTTDLGDFNVRGTGHRLSGRVILAGGEPLPAKTRLMVTRHQSSDSMTAEIAPDGTFDLRRVPAEVVSISVRVPSHIMSSKNQSFDQLNYRLIGKMDRDITDLVILLEPGKAVYTPPAQRPQLTEAERPENRPLHGVEALPK